MMNKQPVIVTVIQTRMASSRLPGKAVLPLEGKPLFVRQAQRVSSAKLCGTVVIATTTNEEDDAIENICQQEGFNCFRGDSLDLLDRHYRAALLYNADIVVKIPSDCPLIDPNVIDYVLNYYLDNREKFDFVSNLHPASYPDGNDVEVMPMTILHTAWMNAASPMEREHTTPYIWEHPEEFRIGNVIMEGRRDYSMTHRFTIDYKEDYLFIKSVYEELYPKNPLFTLEDILDLLKKRNDIYTINHHLAGINWYRNHLSELKTITSSQTKMEPA